MSDTPDSTRNMLDDDELKKIAGGVGIVPGMSLEDYLRLQYLDGFITKEQYEYYLNYYLERKGEQ